MSSVFIAHGGGTDQALASALHRGIARFSGQWRARLGRSRTGAGGGTSSDGPWEQEVDQVDDADWLVLLASPESARSERVGRVIQHWADTRGTDRLLVVAVRGTLVWRDDTGAVDLERSTAAHPALQGLFTTVPRHMDMTWVGGGDDLSMRNPRFREDVAELAAPMLGRAKDELVGEDVARQRRTVRRVWGTSGLLVALTAVALVAAGAAVAAANEADRQRERAQQERERAEEQERLANEQRALAEEQRRLSDSRRLAAASGRVESEDGALSRLLALEAYESAATEEAESALLRGTEQQNSWTGVAEQSATARLVGHEPRPVAAEFSPEGTRVATLDVAGDLRIWQVGSIGSPVVVEGVVGRDLAFSGDGERVAVATGSSLVIVDRDGRVQVDVDTAVSSVAALGDDGFLTGGTAGATVRGSDGERLGFFDTALPVEFVGASEDGEVLVVQSSRGEIITLDAELREQSRWTFTPEQRTNRPAPTTILAVAPDGGSVVLPPDGRGELRWDTVDESPDQRQGVIAGQYATADGAVVGVVANPTSYLPVAATSADFGPDGSIVAISPGGLESPASIASTTAPDGLTPPPLPPRADLVRVAPDGGELLVAGDDVGATLLLNPAAEGADDQRGARIEGAGGRAVDPALLQTVCQLAGRNLSEAEWDTFLPGRDYRATCPDLASPHVPGVGLAGPEPTDESDQPSDDSPTSPSPEPSAPVPTSRPAAPSAPPTRDASPSPGAMDFDFANMAYERSCSIMDVPVLEDGVAEDFAARLELTDVLDRDMDMDGVVDAVLLLECIDANALHRLVWVVDGRSDDEIVWVGDPLDVFHDQILSVEPGRVVTETPVFAPDDPLCCPSGTAERTFVLTDGSWIEQQ